MPRMIFPNLPVKDVKAARAFYESLGFSINEMFSDEQTASVILEENITLMLLEEEKFRGFIKNDIAARETTEVLLALSCDTREEVVDLAAKARAAGADAWNDPMDMGFMYAESFRDLDGHVLELVWMDPAAAAGGPPEDAQAATA